jgi:hypothetical protein
MLMAHDIKPGREMGELLRHAYEAQLDGAFDSEQQAEDWLHTQLPGRAGTP